MGKRIILAAFIMFGISSYAQNETFPYDLRQHNLLVVSPHLFNPVYSLDQERQHDLGYWSRWQWQMIDNTPTTLMTNYSLRMGNLATGIGYFDNTTSVFKQRGLSLNLAYQIPLDDRMSVRVGTNVFGYIQDREYRLLFRGSPSLGYQRDLIVRFAPAVQFKYDKFGFTVGFENLPDFSLQRIGTEVGWGSKTYQFIGDYSFDIGSANGQEQTLRPILYVKRVQGFDTQVGVNTLFTSGRYWAQAGVNSYYGPSLGAGMQILDGLSLGGLIEKGQSQINQVRTRNFSLELYAKYSFGRPGSSVTGARRYQPAIPAKEEIFPKQEETEVAVATEPSPSEIEAALMEERARIDASKRQDSLRMAAMLADQQKIIDSLKQVQIVAVESGSTVGTGRVYQEVASEEGLESGYYLIANVFETERYLKAFVDELGKIGITPKTFYRRTNGYNYVYLERFKTFAEADKARKSQFQGGYPGELWIFRIR
ncbi:type IX secretion system membrane protein PorP/SprF [Robiginitalea sp.]|nr:type IX secretion system membrane protein PorP/SprF [Robiginitalea sp.]